MVAGKPMPESQGILKTYGYRKSGAKAWKLLKIKGFQVARVKWVKPEHPYAISPKQEVD